jgi:hypothetical protein
MPVGNKNRLAPELLGSKMPAVRKTMSRAFAIRRPIIKDRDSWLEMQQALWPDFPKNEHVREIDLTITARTDVVFVAELQSPDILPQSSASWQRNRQTWAS